MLPFAPSVDGWAPAQSLAPTFPAGAVRSADRGRALRTSQGSSEGPIRRAERVHMTVTATAPDLWPRTWYGMPAYANADGKVVVFFQDSGKFSYRYSTLGFQDAANLDDGDLWPVSYALKKWSTVVEKKVAELVKAAVS